MTLRRLVRAARCTASLRVAVALLSAVALAAISVSLALADATPVQLLLVYMPNVSNTDTPRASGIAELVMLEGEVRISVTDLPHLDDGQQYVAWVVNSESNEFFRLGAFNSAEGTNSAHYETVLPDVIPNKKWNLLLLTVEDSADAARPSVTHSIAGVFPGAANDPLPMILPNTGGLPDDGVTVQTRSDWMPSAGLATLLMTATGVAGYVVGRKQR